MRHSSAPAPTRVASHVSTMTPACGIAIGTLRTASQLRKVEAAIDPPRHANPKPGEPTGRRQSHRRPITHAEATTTSNPNNIQMGLEAMSHAPTPPTTAVSRIATRTPTASRRPCTRESIMSSLSTCSACIDTLTGRRCNNRNHGRSDGVWMDTSRLLAETVDYKELQPLARGCKRSVSATPVRTCERQRSILRICLDHTRATPS